MLVPFPVVRVIDGVIKYPHLCILSHLGVVFTTRRFRDNFQNPLRHNVVFLPDDITQSPLRTPASWNSQAQKTIWRVKRSYPEGNRRFARVIDNSTDNT